MNNPFKRTKRDPDLQHRFIARVLAPPFLVLLALGLVSFWQLNKFVSNQSTGELKRASVATAAKLEREFAIRQTVLQRTGEEIFTIKSDYRSAKQLLDKNRDGCAAFLKQKRTFVGAPDGVCDPFLPQFASAGPRQQAIDDGYVKQGQQLLADQNRRLNERLAAYKQFFPETTALLVVDTKQQVVSSALSGLPNDAIATLLPEAVAAQKQAVDGKVMAVNNLQLGVFAYAISDGSVLAAYNVNSDSFIKDSWNGTPIDRSKALAIITDAQGSIVYPPLNINSSVLEPSNTALRTKRSANVSLNGVDNIAVASEVGASKWLVVVASPKNAVLAPVYDAQLAAVIVIGTLLLGFLWVGAFFIQRTVRSILRLVGGAVLFASGKLTYQIKLTNADKEFVQLADTMNAMATRIAVAEKEIDEKNKEFISIATHELRTPLTAIKGNLSMAYEDMGDSLPDNLKPIVAEAFKGTTRLAALVNDMLDMARLDGGRVEFVIAPQDIAAVAKDVVDSLQITAKDKPVTLSYNPAGAQPVLADAAKLRIVITNFVSNAIKYNRPNGSVTVSHSLKDGQLVTKISDTGLGIPDDQKAHLFEKFFRVQNDDRKDIVGTGLGMYITREYVLKMGGQVWFESVHGQGTSFYFSLPLASPAQAPTSPAS